MPVGLNPFGHTGTDLQRVTQGCPLNLRQKQLKGSAHRVVQRHAFDARLETALLNLRIVQHIVDHSHQVVGRLAGVVEHLERFGLALNLGQQQGVEAQNRVHRCAQLVAHCGDEVLAHLQRQLQLVAFGLKLLLVAQAFLQRHGL